MINQDHYTAILKAKPGELGACKTVSPLIKGIQFTAIFEVNEDPSEDLDAQIAEAWGPDDVVIIDNTLSLEKERAFALKLAARGVRVMPAVSYFANEDRRAGTGGLAKDLERGLCIRIPAKAIHAQGASCINDLLRDTGFAANEVRLVVDFGDVRQENLAILKGLAIGALRNIPSADKWKDVVFAATSIPKTLYTVATAGQITAIRRNEWAVYRSLIESDLPRIPTYGDYAVNHPDRSKPAGNWAPAANIRYTVEDEFLILRGKHRDGNEATRSLASALMKDERFLGRDYSPGDEELAACAKGKGGPGCGWTWRRRDTSHHIAFKVDRLSSLF